MIYNASGRRHEHERMSHLGGKGTCHLSKKQQPASNRANRVLENRTKSIPPVREDAGVVEAGAGGSTEGEGREKEASYRVAQSEECLRSCWWWWWWFESLFFSACGRPGSPSCRFTGTEAKENRRRKCTGNKNGNNINIIRVQQVKNRVIN